MHSKDISLHQLLEQQVQRTPQAIVVIFGDQQITYQELDQRANQVAHCLTGQGIGKGVPLGLLLNRSLEMVIAIWGTLTQDIGDIGSYDSNAIVDRLVTGG